MTQAIILNDVDRVQRCFDDLASIVTLRPVDWRQRYLAFRQDVNATLARLSAATAAGTDVDPAIRPLVVRLNHLMSLHQAEWPVVGIDLDDRTYVASRETIVGVVASLVSAARGMRTQARASS